MVVLDKALMAAATRRRACVFAAVVLLTVFCGVFTVFAQDAADEFEVVILHDGERTVFVTGADTVAYIVHMAGVEVGEYDIMEPDPDHYISAGETITITRRKLITRTEQEEIPFKTVEITTSLLDDGERELLKPGEPGLEVTTSSQMLGDGKPAGDERENKPEVVEKPETEWVFVGKTGAAISPLDFEDFPLDENGVPQEYAEVMEGQRAAGYSAGKGAGTASGLKAKVGHVAVNPNTIPYGTKLYIRSGDGDFVYGYAIAADTGGALMNGTIDIDLFYNTIEECVINGIRDVDIYILE